MAAPDFGGAGLLQTCGRAQSKGETPGRVQHGHDPQPGHVGRQAGEGEGENRVLQPGGTKAQRKWVTKMAGLCKEEQPNPLGWRVQGRGRGMPTNRFL